MSRKIAGVLLELLLVAMVAAALAEQWVPYSKAKMNGSVTVQLGTGWKWAQVLNVEAEDAMVSAWNGASRVSPPSGTGTDSVWTLAQGHPATFDLNGATKLIVTVGRGAHDSAVDTSDSSRVDIAVGR